MRLLAVVNPEASRVEAALTEMAAWFEENCEAAFVTTTTQDELKNTLLRDGPAADRIVIGGGDGTISNALPELLKLNKPLAVLPLGTANDFARGLGLPQKSSQLLVWRCTVGPTKSMSVSSMAGRSLTWPAWG